MVNLPTSFPGPFYVLIGKKVSRQKNGKFNKRIFAIVCWNFAE